MHILITGGCGFVGSNIAVFLKCQHPSWKITCLDNLRRRGSELNVSRLKERAIGFLHADIRNEDDLACLENITHIIDASAEPSVLAGLKNDQRQLININLIGTINLLDLALKHDASFLFLSTSRVYPVESLNKVQYEEQSTRFAFLEEQTIRGASSKGITEDFPLIGYRSFYGSTKLAVELLIEEYRHFKGVQAVINRFGVIAGPYQMGKVDQGVSVLWMASHFWKKDLSYIGFGGTGKQVRDILHIDDVCELIDNQIVNLAVYEGKVLNIGGGLDGSLSLQEMTKICQDITGNIIQINAVEENRPADIRIYLSDTSSINNLTGWQPKLSVKKTFEDIFDWLNNNEQSLKGIL